MQKAHCFSVSLSLSKKPNFIAEQWAVGDASPYNLAILRNNNL